MKKYFTGIILLGLITFLMPPLQAYATTTVSQNHTFVSGKEQTLYNANNGLEDNSANDVVQTEEGYIWVATYAGLARFDGKSFLRITEDIDPDFTAMSIRTLYIAQDNTMYIGSNDKGVYAYKDGNFTAINQPDDVGTFTVRDITEDNNGQIYVATTKGLGKIQDGNIVFLKDPMLNDDFFLAIDFDEANRLWGISVDYSIVVAEKDRVIDTINLSETDDPIFPNTLRAIANGDILIGTTLNSCLTLSYDNKIAIEEIYTTANTSDITGFFRDDKGNIWVTANNGVGYFTSDMHFIEVTGLSTTSSIESMMQDHEGNFWFSSSREGLLLAAQSPFHNVMAGVGEDIVSVNATLLWQDTLYIGTEDGIKAIKDDQSISNELTTAFENVRIRSLFSDSHNNLWISTYSSGHGVVKITPDMEVTKITTEEGLTSNKVRSVTERSNGEIWVATSYGLNVIVNDIVVKTYTEEDGLLNPVILSMCESHQGTMYIGSDGDGIYEIDGDNIVNYNAQEGLASGVVLRITQDPNSNMAFIANAGNTLSILQNGLVRQLEDFATQGNIFDVLFYKDAMIVLSARGLYITTADRLLIDGTDYDFFDVAINAISQITANAWNEIGEDGTLYISCDSTVLSIDTNNPFVNTSTTNTVITYIEIDDKAFYKDLDTIIIPAGSERLSIHFANLTYINNKASEVTFRLEGFSDKPHVTSLEHDSYVSYTNLPDGNYNFTLSGKNANGIETIPNGFVAVSKLTYWYKTHIARSIFILAGVCALGYIIFSYYNLRIKEEVKKKEEYRKITQQSITAIANTIDAKDSYTNGHSVRVATYCAMIGKKLDYTEEQIEKLYYTALLHDIGKLGIPDAILKKESRLTKEEFEVIQAHPQMGADILKDITVIQDISLGAEYHHERYGGGGYPHNLTGLDIPFVARIICVADAFDAMTSKRAYSKDGTIDAVIEEMKQCAGKQFDPDIVKFFITILEDGEIDLNRES